MRLPPILPRHLKVQMNQIAALLLVTLIALTATFARPGSASVLQASAIQDPLSGVLVTLAATADDVELMPDGGLVVQATVTNATGRDLGGVTLRAPVPPRSRVAASWYGEDEGSQLPGLVQGSDVAWSGFNLEDGERLGPFSYRIVPVPGADGAMIFREARVQPEVTWLSPESGRGPPSPYVPGGLRLNGLWGEGGLRRTLLPTGLTVFTRERPDSSTASLRVAIRAGSRDEDDVTSGGSHWLEHAHFLGTVERPNSEIDNDIAVIGGDDNAATSWEYTDYWKLVPAEYFDVALDVLSDQMLHSTFREERFDR